MRAADRGRQTNDEGSPSSRCVPSADLAAVKLQTTAGGMARWKALALSTSSAAAESA